MQHRHDIADLYGLSDWVHSACKVLQGILKGECTRGAAPATTAASRTAMTATRRLWAIAHEALSCLALVRI